MRKCVLLIAPLAAVAAALLLAGCVERNLTINTRPEGAIVILNDEEIGISPVTVGFEWYGDYNVAIRKEGFETLKTHRKLKAPWYDGFPFDLFAQILPHRIVDSYEWKFELEEKKQISPDQLIQNAEQLKSQLQ
ncbi:MAG TPA: PEGA domain-containing protein [Sedimentisphaerales bacterium]|nr:PEGA domain-containing protein [Sedimentisphaerales bacterium]